MEEARALVPRLIDLFANSVRIGHVPVMENPALIIAESIVSHPEEATPFSSESLCL